MIYPNSTIFVQMAHFVGAYLLLRFFLWRPVIALIQQDEERERELETECRKQQAFVEQKEQELKQVWFRAQESFLAVAPQPVSRRFDKLVTIKKFVLHAPEISPQQMQVLVDTITKKVCE